MKNSKALQAILIISGLIAISIGATILFFPVMFHASSGIDLGGNVSLLSETRAPGAALFVSGILMMLGAFVREMTFTSLVLTVLVYLSYGFARVFSMMVDGMPAESLITATVLEIVIGLAGVWGLNKFRSKSAHYVQAIDV